MKNSFQWKDNPGFLADYFEGNYRPPKLTPKRFHEYGAAKPKETEVKDFDKDGLGFLIKFVRKQA